MPTNTALRHRGLPSLALILLLAFVALAAGLGLRDPSPPDEPRFVLAAKAMVESGDWLIPRRGSEVYGHKPPTFMWLQAASYTLVRDWQVAFLLPSLLAGMGTLWLTWDLGRRLWNRRIATHAALALLVTLQFGLQAKRGQIDMVLVFFTTLALWAFARHLLVRRDLRMLVLGGVAAGVGTVTKGVGFLPLLMFLPWLLLPSTLRGPAWRSGFSWALAGFVAGALVWLAPMLWHVLDSRDPALQAYARDILLRQTGQRYLDPWHHHQPPWYYLQVILTLWLPGALLLPWLLPAWWRRLRRREPRQWLLLGWSLLVLVFFTLSPAKREVYLLPALPAMCLAAAPLLPGLLRFRGVRATLFGYVLVMSATLLLLGVAGFTDAGGQASQLAESRGMSGADASRFFVGLSGLGMAGLLGALVLRRRRAVTAVVLFTVWLWMGYGLVLAPALDASSSARALMQGVDLRMGEGDELGLVGWSEQQLLQAVRPAQEFGFSQPLSVQWTRAHAWLLGSPETRWLLVPDDALSPCVITERTLHAGRSNRHDWRLVPAVAWQTGCVAASR